MTAVFLEFPVWAEEQVQNVWCTISKKGWMRGLQLVTTFAEKKAMLLKPSDMWISGLQPYNLSPILMYIWHMIWDHCLLRIVWILNKLNWFHVWNMAITLRACLSLLVSGHVLKLSACAIYLYAALFCAVYNSKLLHGVCFGYFHAQSSNCCTVGTLTSAIPFDTMAIKKWFWLIF